MAASFACAAPADAERPPYGALKQLPGRDGCTGVFFGSCRPGTLGGDSIVLSPDERFAYAASKEGTVAGYSRDPESGALRSISGVGGCVVGRATFNEVAAASVCIEWDLLGPMPDVLGIAVSPDGRHVYFGSGGLTFVPPDDSARPGALAILERDVRTGTLRPDGCVATAVDGCAAARGVGSVIPGLVVSPDGKNVYVASSVGTGATAGSSVAAFARDPASGGLSQLPGTAGCFAPPEHTGCQTARGLSGGTSSVVMSPDGRYLYVATQSYGGFGRSTEGTILAFGRDPVTGALMQLPGEAGCLASDGRDGCARARPLGNWPTQLPELALDPSGTSAYAAFVTGGSGLSGGVTVLRRDPGTGALVQLQGDAGCVSARRLAGCSRGRGLEVPTGITASPDGRNVYVSANNSGAIAAFSRGADGALSQLPGSWGCLGFAPLFDEGCAPGPAMRTDITFSGDGSYGYVPDESGINVFARNGPSIGLRIPARHCGRPNLRIAVNVWTQGGLRRAAVRLDRRLIRSSAKPRFRVVVPARRLATRGGHRLSVLATDRRGRKSQTVRRVGGCGRG